MVSIIKGKKRLRLFRLLRANLPWLPVTAGKLFFLKYHGLPPEAGRTPFKGNVCWASPEHVDALAGCCNKPYVFRKRFEQGDHCLMAVNAQGQVVGYEWFSTNDRHVECKYNYAFSIPDDAVYAYDAYILKDFRMKGIWNIFRERLAELMREKSRHRIITYIEYGNRLSFKIHFRFGYELYEMVDAIKIGNHCYSKQYPVAHNKEYMRLLANPQRR